MVIIVYLFIETGLFFGNGADNSLETNYRRHRRTCVYFLYRINMVHKSFENKIELINHLAQTTG